MPLAGDEEADALLPGDDFEGDLAGVPLPSLDFEGVDEAGADPLRGGSFFGGGWLTTGVPTGVILTGWMLSDPPALGPPYRLIFSSRRFCIQTSMGSSSEGAVP